MTESDDMMQADFLWRECVKIMWGRRCAFEKVSPCSGRLEVHHIISKIYHHTRCALMNGIPLCTHHHQYDREVAPHVSQRKFEVVLKEKYPGLAEWKEMQGCDREIVRTHFKSVIQTLEDVKKGLERKQ